MTADLYLVPPTTPPSGPTSATPGSATTVPGSPRPPPGSGEQITAEAAAEGRAITHWFEDLSKSAFKPGVVRARVRRAARSLRASTRCAACGCCTTTG